MNNLLKYSLLTLAVGVFGFTLFVGSVNAEAVSVSCSGTSGAPTAVTEADLAGDDVTFTDGGDGWCVLDNSISAASVVINTGVTITHTMADVDGVTITTTGNFEIQAGAYINADSKGCQDSLSDSHGWGPDASNICTYLDSGGQGAGRGHSGMAVGATGAGYGGGGAVGTTSLSAGSAYGNNIAPDKFGASGGTAWDVRGGTGGGLIRLDVSGIFTNNGSVSVNGGNGLVGSFNAASGGGSGGSIYITTSSILGSGSLSANGGNGYDGSSTHNGGGGGGGRIAILYTSSTFSFSSSSVRATGGDTPDSSVDGSNGTAYVEDTDDTAVSIYSGFDYSTDYVKNSWTVDSGASGQRCEVSSDTSPSVTATNITLGGTLACADATLVSLNFSASTSFSVLDSTSFSVTTTGSTVDFNIPAGNDQIWTNVVFTGAAQGYFTINDAVSIDLNNTTITANAQWTSLTGLDLDGTSTINANSKGCQALNDAFDADGYGPNASNVCGYQTVGSGWGDGAADNFGVQGGGHGGSGGVGSTAGFNTGGATYGTSTAPVLFGSSGGSASANSFGGAGGGYIRLIVNGGFVLGGSVSANGGTPTSTEDFRAGGGGSGGSVYITINGALSGAGSVSSVGGSGVDKSSADGGGGGGGRVAIYYGSDPNSLIAGLSAGVTTAGGSGPGTAVDGTAGSLYTLQSVYLSSIVITDTSGYTNDSTPVITITQSGATPTHVAFSCDNSNWSSWLTYPDDEVVNDGDGPAFDITADATGCSATNELKTIYAKIKDGSSESSVVSDTTTYDTASPGVMNVSATNPNGTYTTDDVLTITVQFDESTMVVTGTPQIELDMNGTDRQANYVSTAADTLSFTYTIVNGDNKTDLDYTGTDALSLSGGTISDLAGNTANLTLPSPGAGGSLASNTNINVSTNQAPTVASITAVQQSNGSVLITFIMDDADDDDTLQALVQYNVGGGLTKATLSEVDVDTFTDNGGDPQVENDDAYQVGNASGYILSSSGANTVSTIWNAPTDATGLDISTAVITVTPYDGTEAGTPSSSSAFDLDTLAPTVVSASYKDINGNGTVDRVDLVFNENIVVTSYNTSDWSFPEVGSITLDDSSASYLADTVLVTVTADANETGGVTPPTVLYTNNAGRLTDEFGNSASTFGAPQTVTDLSAPQIKSFDYKDSVLVDGKIDTITVNFTEAVTDASYLSANDLLFDNVGELTGSAFGANSSNLISGSVESIDIPLGTASTQVDTHDSSGILAISSQNSFSITDGTTANSSLKSQSQATFVDESATFLTQIGYQDTNSDGQIDSAVAVFSEPTTISYTDTDWVVTANGLTGMDLSDISSGNGTSSITFTATASANKTGATSAPSLTFTPTTGSIQDAYSNATATFTQAFVDQAKPVILSTSPTDSSVAIPRTNSIAFTFSEPMASTSWVEGTTGFDSTPNASGWSGAWSGTGNTTYTLSHAPLLCVTSYTITTVEGDITPTGGEDGYTTLSETGGGSTFDGSLVFTTASCSSASQTGSSGTASSSTFTNPVTDDLSTPETTTTNACTGITSGSRVSLAWSVTSGVGFVNLYYSTNNGSSYTSIVKATQNTGAYSWTVPSGLTDNSSIQFKIEGTDLVNITSTYVTAPMNVCGENEEVEDVTNEDVGESGDNADESNSQQDQAPDTVVPIGMALEGVFGDKWQRDAAKRGIDATGFPTGEVAIGSLVKLADDGNPNTQTDSAVYYIGSDHRRHPFPNEAVYKTWFTGFYGIKILDAEMMSSIPMGPMATYRPGSTLVKFPSVNKVYVVDAEGSLRWITSEQLAQALYGDEWNKFVIDVSEAFYSSYTFGNTLTSLGDMTWDSVMAVYGR
ncbi:Ig-like domain-containing protein [Patescibacteria group bacterium]|nr:Ig-like domain-containing protein [Patescibacteria group bacterium]